MFAKIFTRIAFFPNLLSFLKKLKIFNARHNKQEFLVRYILVRYLQEQLIANIFQV